MSPYADPEKQRAAMIKWRADHPTYHKEYDATHERSEESMRNRKVRNAQRYREQKGPIRFVGVDGEGMGDGYDHKYYTLRSGDALIAGTHTQALTSYDCLDFVSRQPYGPIYTIFSGNYDFTMWLRDLPETVVKDVLNRQGRMSNDGRSARPVKWQEFRIDYIPHKRLSVRRDNEPPIVVHDVFGFFQCSFLDAISSKGFGGYGGWGIGHPLEVWLVAEGKFRRGNTDVLSVADIEYNRIECKLLAELMHKLHDTADQIMLSASPYEGAGSLASSLLNMYVGKPIKEKNRVAKKAGRPLEPVAPPDFADVMPSWDAYYGGRFEITAHGPVPGPVYEYDINSAYPAAIEVLPCLRHGRWVPYTSGAVGPTLGHLRWHCEDGTSLGPLPHRNKAGNVTFPLSGSGWYWSVEWPSEPDIYIVDTGYTWQQQCQCRPYAWIRQVYAARKAHKQAGRIGPATTLKLAYNSCYGKLAQQVGQGPWRNSVLAGLVTAQTRRWIRDAAEQSPDDILMIATDGVYSRTPLTLPEGTGLGEWESHVFQDGLHFVRPGIYFTPDGVSKVKTRGVSRRAIQENAGRIIAAFDRVHEHPEWLEPPYDGDNEWSVDVSANGMISLKLAYSQNRPQKAGYVGIVPHSMSYSPRPKRVPIGFVDGVLRSAPPATAVPYESVGHGKSMKLSHDGEEAVASGPENVVTQLSLF